MPAIAIKNVPEPTSKRRIQVTVPQSDVGTKPSLNALLPESNRAGLSGIFGGDRLQNNEEARHTTTTHLQMQLQYRGAAV
jgi:hypothetical protein